MGKNQMIFQKPQGEIILCFYIKPFSASKGEPFCLSLFLLGNFNEIMEVLSNWLRRIKSFLPRPSKDRKCGVRHNWSLFSTLQIKFKMWYGWVIESSCHQRRCWIVFKFYVEYEHVDYNPNSGTNWLFQYNFLDILCGQCLSWLTQMFQCVKAGQEKIQRDLTK